MYRSPIDLNISQVIEQQAKEAAEKFDNLIFNAVYEVVPSVDKDELLRAFHYDRDQYDKGFVDGKAAAMDELVRCKDCKHSELYFFADNGTTCIEEYKCLHHRMGVNVLEHDDFCSYGERRSDGNL